MNLFDLQPEGSKAVVPWLRRDNLLPGTCLPPTVLLLVLFLAGWLAEEFALYSQLERRSYPEKYSNSGEQKTLKWLDKEK